MKKKKVVQLLATCECGRVKVLCDDNREYWQESIARFDTLPKETCWSCREKQKTGEKSVDEVDKSG